MAMFEMDGQNQATLIFIGNQGEKCAAGVGTKGLFPDGPEVRERQIRNSSDKPEIINELTAMVGEQDQAHAILSQKAGLLLDEMLENAIYAAPHGRNGEALYCKGTARKISANESIKLRYFYDGNCLAFEVRDSWGSLRAAQVFHFLAINTADTDPSIDRTGRGLFFMWRLFDQFYVNIRPGMETTVGGCLYLG
jgi:hypothetical protein